MASDNRANNTHKPPSSIRQRNMLKIMQAAEIEFAKHGYKATSIQTIAERAGLPKANIHYYFSSKQALYGSILSNILKLWDAVLNEMKPEDDPAAALTRYIHSKINFSQQYPLASRIFALELMTGGKNLRAHYQQGYTEWFQQRCAVFQAWADQGKMAAVDPAHLIFLIWSSTQHYADFDAQVTAALGKPDNKLQEADFKQAADTLTEIILRGCGISTT